MAKGIYAEIKNRIDMLDEGSILFTADFSDIASAATIRKYLGRQIEENKIRRVLDGIYEKPVYSKLLQEYVPVDPDAVATAIARNYRWTIAPSGDVALNKLGISTQVPVVWTYISDGPYREYSWDNIIISFKHRTNREISFMSDVTALIIEAIRTLGKNLIDEKTIAILKNRLSDEEKRIILREAMGTSEWIYGTIKRVCD